MTALSTLDRLCATQLDARRRDLAQIERQRVALQNEIHRISTELENEGRFVERHPESSLTFVAYRGRQMDLRLQTQGQLAVLEQRLVAARQALMEAWQESERYRYLLEMERERARAEQKRREEAEMNEIATLNAGRRIQAARAVSSRLSIS